MRSSLAPFAQIIALGLVSIPLAVSAQSDPDPARFEKEIDVFRQYDLRNSAPRDAVLFVGSSSIRLWPTAVAFPTVQVINRGFGGAHISDVNHFAREMVLRHSPEAIYFYAGDNDVWDGKTPNQVEEDFAEFLDLVWTSRSDTHVHFISIKPSPSRWSRWDQMRLANELIEQMAADNDRLTYINIAGPMLGADARPDSSLFVADMLHLSDRGYRLWESVVGPYVRLSARE